MQKFSTRFLIMAVAFAVCLIVSNVLALRVWQLGSLPLQLSGADVIFPISYILNDCLTEVYGYRKMRLVLWLSFGLSAVTAGVCAAVCLLPLPFDSGALAMAGNFDHLFVLVPRTTAASLLAFICGSSFNSFIVSKMKVASGGRQYWLRAMVSSVGGAIVDSCIFIPVAYFGLLGSEVLLSMMGVLVALKLVYELLLLPLSSAFVRRLKKKEGIDTFDEGISYNPFKISDI